MRQQDKILSRQKTRLNPIKFYSSSCGEGDRGTKQRNMTALQTGSCVAMQERRPHCMNKCFEFLPSRSSATSCARSALASLNQQR